MIKGLDRILDTCGDRVILLSGEGRAFCAGGDIKAQAHAIRNQDREGPAAYFRDEYGFNKKLFHHPGTYVSYLNGIVMGGGYGISGHGSHLITCEHTQFAMPEVKIGFFPDVGAVYHLARVRNELGTYMALTGNTVGAADMLYMGLAHAYVAFDRFAHFKDVLSSAGVDEAIASARSAPQDDATLCRYEDVIAGCFVHDDVLAIVDALKTHGTPFALATAAEIEARSPMSVRVALAHIRKARGEGFDSVIARDLSLSQRFLDLPDFPEGVRAAVIDKDRNPRWNPRDLAGLSSAEAALYLES